MKQTTSATDMSLDPRYARLRPTVYAGWLPELTGGEPRGERGVSQSTPDSQEEVHMVTVTLLPEYPRDPDEGSRVIPLDAGRWALLTGGSEVERRRVANDLRVMAHRRTASPSLAA
jgi:hypothetical protein